MALEKANDSVTAQKMEPEKRLEVLKIIIRDINKISAELTPKSSQAKLSPENNLYLQAAIGLIQQKILSKLIEEPRSSDLSAMLVRSFGLGAEETARLVFTKIISKLLELYAVTGDKDVGFVFEPNLPAGMGALASGGKKISVGSDALTGQRKDELAADLIHEGSHAIDCQELASPPDLMIKFTSDFTYINQDSHFYLPQKLAVANAANYEQVARELLGLKTAPTNSAAAAMHALKAPPLALAHALLSSRASRAWVRAHDMRTRPENRELVGQSGLIAVLPADSGLRDAWYASLYGVTATVMEAVQKKLTLASADTPDSKDLEVQVLIEEDLNTSKTRITFATILTRKLSPEDLARLSLAYMLRDMLGVMPEFPPGFGEGLLSTGDRFRLWVSSPPSPAGPGKQTPPLAMAVQYVFDLIFGIERLDRAELRPALAYYYGQAAFKKPQSS